MQTFDIYLTCEALVDKNAIEEIAPQIQIIIRKSTPWFSVSLYHESRLVSSKSAQVRKRRWSGKAFLANTNVTLGLLRAFRRRASPLSNSACSKARSSGTGSFGVLASVAGIPRHSREFVVHLLCLMGTHVYGARGYTAAMVSEWSMFFCCFLVNVRSWVTTTSSVRVRVWGKVFYRLVRLRTFLFYCFV